MSSAYHYVADGEVVDGSWELNILVTDLQLERTLRVMGDTHIGGVMVKLVQALDIALDWSDHALWWPEKNKWLHRARSTLDQYNVQADAKLQFTPMHKNLKVQLPDLQVLELSVDFSIKCFTAVVQTCKELGIRHPEEMSFMRKWDRDDLKKVAKEVHKRKKRGDPDQNGPLSSNGTHHNSSGSIEGGKLSPYPNRSPMGPSPTSTLARPGNTSYMSTSSSTYNTFNGTMSPGSISNLAFENVWENSLANSPHMPTKDASQYLYRPRNFAEKARINCAWLDSSTSLMEQGIKENDFIMLKFKFYNYYDLNPKYDAIRINQIYEQAKWSLISEEIDCTEEEMMVFAALQYQVRIQSGQPQPDFDLTQNNQSEDDEIDAALKDLQESLEGSAISSHGDITHIPELSDYIRVFKPKKLTLKSYKRYFATFKDTFIAFYRSKEESHGPPVMAKIDVRGCEAQPDVNLSSHKYGIKLFVPEPDGMSEICLRFDMEDHYCRWMAACKLASKGKTMADSSYEAEVQALQSFLGLQHTAVSPSSQSSQGSTAIEIQPEDYIAARFFKKLKGKPLVSRIMEAHASVQDMSLIESKLAYIKAWQSLPEYGITYFRIKMTNSKKEELMGVACNRIIRMELSSGDSLKTWRYNTLQSWHVNWEVENVILDFDTEKVMFASMECSCKTIHEFIGGYIFLSMRSTDKNQSLNEEMFHKLTGGWHE
ncbi:fermitin family homolog 2-like [Physella acuta]|uniref:fermitin family homolog 2-like n=1 Tax=Physella acuta TaxID=109671 RepID=UPI0027DC68B3|nr:fermitin family homolog 2-like [Physella acuta]XP_059160189.1 fermitin family homolog 2-like [Physella acuta]XP_059160190.1 fermitin family homolog 2-like [Physella acuta]